MSRNVYSSFLANHFDYNRHLVIRRIFLICQNMGAEIAYLSIYAIVYLFLNFSDDFILSISRSTTSLTIFIIYLLMFVGKY